MHYIWISWMVRTIHLMVMSVLFIISNSLMHVVLFNLCPHLACKLHLILQETHCFIDSLVDWLICHLNGWLICWYVDWLIDLLIELIDFLIDWLIDWYANDVMHRLLSLSFTLSPDRLMLLGSIKSGTLITLCGVPQ